MGGYAKTNDKVKLVGHRALLVYCSRAPQSDMNDSFSPRPVEEPVFSAVGNDSIDWAGGIYSSRIALIGSMLAARRAGKYPAISETDISAIVAVINTIGLAGFTP